MAYVTPVVEHWLEREIAQRVHHEGSIQSATDLHLAPKYSDAVIILAIFPSVFLTTFKTFD